MTKAAVKDKGATTSARYDVERSAAIFQARQQFISSALNMGWQLGLTVIVPVIIGVKLDEHFHSSPSYTLAALVLAIACAVAVVANTIKNVNKDQAKQETKE